MKRVDELTPLLASADPAVRDRAALQLRELGDNAAVEPLFDAIRHPRSANHRGTLLYALQGLDCSGHFLDLVTFALTGSFEAQELALTILRDQNLRPTTAALIAAKALLISYVPPSRTSEADTVALLTELGELMANSA